MMISRKRFFSAGIGASVGALLMPKSNARASDTGAAPEIEGTWRFDNLPAPGGVAVSLHTFARGGVFLEISALQTATGLQGFPRRTTAQGVWEKIGPQTYLKTFEWFAERPTGEIVRVQVREEVVVSGDLLTITKTKLTRYNLDGSFHSEAPCAAPNTVGTRLWAQDPTCP
jgi:hypothetical protein